MRTCSAGVQGQAVWLRGLCPRPLYPTLLLDREDKGMRWILLERITAQPRYDCIFIHKYAFIHIYRVVVVSSKSLTVHSLIGLLTVQTWSTG